MRFLIDTHILIWMLEGDPQLSDLRRGFISDPGSEVFVSVVSYWEIAIKTSIGKLSISKSLNDILDEVAASSSILLLTEPVHTLAVATLPFHHRDPFDRMLVAQAQAEFLDVMTNDQVFADYGLKLI